MFRVLKKIWLSSIAVDKTALHYSLQLSHTQKRMKFVREVVLAVISVLLKILPYSRAGQTTAREAILCGPRALTKIKTPTVNKTFFCSSPIFSRKQDI